MVGRSPAVGGVLSATLGAALLLSAGGAQALDMDVVYHLNAAEADSDVYDVSQGHGGYALSLGGLDFVADPTKGLQFRWNGDRNKWVLDGRIVSKATAGAEPGRRQAFDVTMYFDALSDADLQGGLQVGVRELFDCAYTDGGAVAGKCQSPGKMNVVDTELWNYFELDEDYTAAELTGVAGSPYDGVQVALATMPDDGEYPFQIGAGASGRNVGNGASMWFQFAVLVDPTNQFTPDFDEWLATLNVNYKAEKIPEPASLGLLAIGMLGMTCLRRRWRRHA